MTLFEEGIEGMKEAARMERLERKAERFVLFLEYLKECGENPNENRKFWLGQFRLQEDGVKDGRIHDAAMVAYCRLED